VLRIFIAIKNPSPWPGFEPATFGSSGKHTIHYTTKVTRCLSIFIIRKTAFWDIAPGGLVEAEQSFRSTYCLHHQVDETVWGDIT
jgi:hypothetical protein